MARPDASLPDHDALRDEEGVLAAFFDAARAEPLPPPPPAFLAAVLADAAALAPPAAAFGRKPRGSLARIGAGRVLLGGWPLGGQPLGGWAGATALAVSVALGFWAGMAGLGADYATPTLWPGVATMESATTGIDGFFDLASVEG